MSTQSVLQDRPLALSDRHAVGEAFASTAPVRVCFLIDELATAGTETQLLALLHRLDRRRVTPYLCLLRGDSLASRALEPSDCPVLRLGVGSLCRPATLLRAWRFARFLRRERIDVLQVYFPDSSYFGVPVGWLAGVPAVVRTRNNLGHWLTPLHRRLGRFLNCLTTATVANCDAARQALIEAENPRPESVLVLENGVDLARFASIPPLASGKPARRRVGVVANLRRVKGLDVLVDAAVSVARACPDVSFHIAGEGGEHGSLQQRVRERGLSGHFDLPGVTANIPAFLAGLDVAVLPSRAEGMPNAVLEYMAAGRPIVSTAVGAAPRLLGHGECGLLVSPDDPGALAAAITTLLDDRELACCLGAAARCRAREHFSREAMVLRFEEFFLNLARDAGRRT
jgi:glycosyltransferase involved in cell wall biosynthesis